MSLKVLVIGIDALDPRIVDALSKKLPNFKKLETYSKLQTTIPPETPVAWSAASTGSNPGRYGIFDFLSRNPKTYLPRLNLATEKAGALKTSYTSAMQGIPFWRVLSQNNIQTTVIRWPVTFPAEKINGRMLSGLGVVDIKGMLNSYSFYTDKKVGETEEGAEKVIPVKIENNSIETYISGPLSRKGKELIDIRVPMKIVLNTDNIVLNINGRDYTVKENDWSEMIHTKFKFNIFMEVHGIFRVRLISKNPFKLYMTSIQIDPEKQAVKITSPDEYGKELVENIGDFYTLGMAEDTKAVTENRIDESVLLEQIKQIEQEREKMFFYEFERFNDGLFAFVFDAGDRLKHIFWENKVLDNSSEFVISKEIEDYYVDKDRFLGKVLSKLDENTKLIILSDHGFNSFEKQVNINNWLVENRYMTVKGDKNASMFGFADWENTKAYSLGFTSIYLNLNGREDSGCVKSEESDALLDEIVSKLKELKDNGKQVITNIYKSKDVYKGNYVSEAPDLIVGFEPGYRMSWKSAVGSLDDLIISDNTDKWTGDHLIDRSHVPGVLFTNFTINKKGPSICDIAPTVLKLFGVGIPETVDGQALI